MAYARVWNIRLGESRTAPAHRRFRVTLTNENQDHVTGYGLTAQDAYRRAEIQLVVKPGFLNTEPHFVTARKRSK